MAGSADGGAARTPFGIHLAAGAVAAAAGAFASALFRDVPVRLAVVAIVIGGYAALAGDARASLATAGLGYLLFNGFLVNRYGELTWDGATSTWHLTILALTVAAGLGLRLLWTYRDRVAVDSELHELIDHIESKRKG